MRTATCFFSFRTLLLATAIAVYPPATFPEGTDVAIVVRPDVPVDNLPFSELRKVMLGDRQFWASNLKVTLLVRAPGAREREVVLKTIYQMSEAQYRQYWIAKVFRAEAPSAPRIVYSSEMATDLAASIAGAVAFVDSTQVPKGLKVLKINGLLPGQAGYPVH